MAHDLKMWKRQIRTKITFIVLPMHRLLMRTGLLFDVFGNQEVNKTMASRKATCQCVGVTLSRTLPSPFKVGDAVDASLLGNVHRDLTSLVYLSLFLLHIHHFYNTIMLDAFGVYAGIRKR
jgi:hypothetical protein